MKIEIELTDEQAANFLVEFDRLVDGGDRHIADDDETLFDVLILAKRAILRQTIRLGDIVTHNNKPIDDQFIVRGLHSGKVWLWWANEDGKWMPWGHTDLDVLTKLDV